MALEAIDFQGPELARILTEGFEEILNAADAKQAQASAAIDRIQKATFEYTGIKIKLIVDTYHDPQIAFPVLNNNSIFLSPFFQGFASNDYNHNLKRMKEFKNESFVDLKNAKVGGFFSTIELPIYMGLKSLKKYKLTPGEAAAVFAHELGHGFTSYEFLSRTVMTNQALAAATRALNEYKRTNNHDKLVVVIKDLGKEVDNDQNYFQEIFESTDENIICNVIVGKTLQRVDSATGVKGYDAVSCEAQADVFSTRLGLGRDLAIALSKIFKATGATHDTHWGKMLTLFFSIVVGGLITAVIMASFPVKGIIYFALVNILSSSSREAVYDTPQVRLKRIREQVLIELKNKDLSAVKKDSILKQLNEMEELINNTHERVDYHQLIADFTNPFSRRARKNINIQRELEVLVANDVYAKAAALSMLK